MNETLPIVFCHGLLGWGDDELERFPYFVCAHELKEDSGDTLPPFIFPSTGPVSSLHDQACELFFQLKGGLTDYGAEHSAVYGHKRYTRFYGDEKDFDPSKATRYGGCARYPQWDKVHPLDFVGHSMGAPVVRMLQYLLAADFFHENCGFSEHTDESWVHSLTAVAGALNGSSLTWILGADPETGILEKDARTVQFLCSLIKIVGAYQNRSGRDHFIFDLHLDQWDLSEDLSFSDRLSALAVLNKSFSDGADWAMYDLTPNAMEKSNVYMIEYPGTWYFSYTTKATWSLLGVIEWVMIGICHIVLWPSALLIGNYRTKNSRWKSLVKTWRHNDGMIPTEAQRLPYVGRSGAPSKKRNTQILPGVWVEQKRSLVMDHAEPAMMPHWCRKKAERALYQKMVEQIIQTR
jgi:triacylglycerol lipase